MSHSCGCYELIVEAQRCFKKEHRLRERARAVASECSESAYSASKKTGTSMSVASAAKAWMRAALSTH